MYNYNALRLRFRQLAPTTDDYCAHCKLVFDVLLEELELKNAMRSDCQARTFSPDYDSLRHLLRIGKKRYYETLDWLDQHKFIQYVYENEFVITLKILHLDGEDNDPEFDERVTQDRIRRKEKADAIRLTRRLDNIDPKLWESLRRVVLERDGHVCRYCGAVFGKMEIDHVVPLIKGGTNTVDNLVVSCQRCNRAKGSKDLHDFLATL